MEELVNIIVNNGVDVACVLYFMHFNSTTLKSLTDTVNKVNESLVLFNERLHLIADIIFQDYYGVNINNKCGSTHLENLNMQYSVNCSCYV